MAEETKDKVEYISNVPNEIVFVGCILNNPDNIVEYGQWIRSKYDFYSECTRFFYDSFEVMYQSRTQKFTKENINIFMSENSDRLKEYKQYNGYKLLEQWILMAKEEDINKSYKVLKKYSLLREYQRNGFNIDKIVNHKKFNTWKAQDIYRLIRSKCDKINTVINENENAIVLNQNVVTLVDSKLEKPDMGLITPYFQWNELFRGLITSSFMCVGMLSNAGKSRFMMKLIAYITLFQKQKCMVMLNEMTEESMQTCMLTTVINNPEFQTLHNINLVKPEREISLGLYKDDSGDYIYRNKDENGKFIETVDEYKQRLYKESEEYRKVIAIAKWIENEQRGLIYCKDMCGDYSDQSLEFEIKKANLTNGIKYFFYDTLKQDINVFNGKYGDWSQLKATATKLSELAKNLNAFVYGSIQLTDDAQLINPDELTSNNVANAKQMKHVLDVMNLFAEIPKKMYGKYQYYSNDDINNDWGEPVAKELDHNKRYYIDTVDKNRYGRKEKLLFSLDLDLNQWFEEGIVFRK